MRILFLILGLISLLALLIFAVENVTFWTTYNLFLSLNKSGIITTPIIVAGLLGIITGAFFTLFIVSKPKKNYEESSDNW